LKAPFSLASSSTGSARLSDPGEHICSPFETRTKGFHKQVVIGFPNIFTLLLQSIDGYLVAI
jgi:hypothetical protein